MRQQHEGNRHRGTAVLCEQTRIAAPDALALGGRAAGSVQQRQYLGIEQRIERRHLPILQTQRSPCRRIEIRHPPLGIDEQHQVSVYFHHLGQTPAVLFGLHPRGDFARHADHLDHRAGIGLADGMAGGLEPQVVTIPMAHPVGHRVIAVHLQRVAAARRQLGPVFGVEQRFHELATQLLRPIAEQPPGRWRGVEKASIGRVPGDQVGGVFGDQPIQTPGACRIPLGQDLCGRLSTAREHPVLRGVGNKGPDQDALVVFGLHPFDSPLLRQTSADQRGVIDGQKAQQLIQRAIGQQRQQGSVQLDGIRVLVQQQARLRIQAEQRRLTRQAARACEQAEQQLAYPAQRAGTDIAIGGKQQQPGYGFIQIQRQHGALNDTCPAQAAGKPAVQPTDNGEVEQALAAEPLMQQAITGLQRITQAGRQLCATALMGVDAGTGLPGHVVRLAYPGAAAQHPAQGIGARVERYLFTLQTQPGVKANGSCAHKQSV